MPRDDAWDWPLLLYVATTLLRHSERAFWRMTPRKLSALTAIHTELQSGKSSGSKPGKTTQQGYIDQIF